MTMNVQFMQMVQAKASTKAPEPIDAKQSDQFGKVFQQALTQPTVKESVSETNMESTEFIQAVLKSEDVQELFDLLGITLDDALIVLEDGQVMDLNQALEELNPLLQALGISETELQEIVEHVLGEEVEAKDAWDLLTMLISNEPQLQSLLTAGNKGDAKLTPKQAEQVTALLQTINLVSKEVDLTSMQETKTQPVNQMMQALLKNMESTEETPKVKVPFMTFMSSKEQTTTDVASITSHTVQTRPNTFQITLPQNQSAQSEALIKEMQAIVAKAQMSNNQGVTRLLIKLYPENLGSLRIELSQHEGVLSARILASTASGRELLDNQLHQLKQAFVQQGLQVERIDVGQTMQDSDRQQREQQGFFNQFFKRQQEEEQQEQHAEPEQSFEDILNEEVQ